MIPPREEWQLDTQRLGRRVLVYDCLESTNTQAAALADDPANDGIVVLADEQTAGRGQHGRTWQCPPRSGVLMSGLLFPPPELRRPAVLTAWAAVSVCEAIREATGLQAKIKWPNDVLIQGRKVCGILIEQRSVLRTQYSVLSTRPSPAATSLAQLPVSVIVGIGLNVNQSADVFKQAGLKEAASIGVFIGRHLDTHDLARRLIAQLDEEYSRLCEGDLGTLEACWKWRLGLLGKPVVAECHDGTHQGRLREVGWEWVQLELADGKQLCLRPEAVRHLKAGAEAADTK